MSGDSDAQAVGGPGSALCGVQLSFLHHNPARSGRVGYGGALAANMSIEGKCVSIQRVAECV